MAKSYDILIIGGGQAGIPLAYDLAEKGKRVALAERKNLGGSCVNFGCIPTKAVIASARVAQLGRRGREFGLKIPAVKVNFPAVLERAKGILMQSRISLRQGFEGSKNPKLLPGHARFEGREKKVFRLRVGSEVVTASQVVLDTGTRTDIPEIEGLAEVDFIHAGNWLEKAKLPKHLAVIGGGYIGLEMGQFYQRMGSRVTIIHDARHVVPKEDEDVSEALQQFLESEGITFRLDTRVTRIAKRSGRLQLTLEGKGRPSRITASDVFVATGRRPNTDDLGLERVGVKLSEDGIVAANSKLSTSVPGIWAAGDIRGGPMFTHTSWDDYRILLSQIAGDASRTTKRVVPYAIFTDPELGRAGMTEKEAKEKFKKIQIGRFEMKKNGKAKEIGEPGGFIKVVVNARTKRILGAAVLAAEGAELIHMYIDIMNAGAPYTVIRDAVHIHPTLAEAVQSAVSSME